MPHLGNIGISIIRFFLQTFHLTAVELVRRRQNLSLIRQPTKAGIKIDIKRRVLRFQRRDICLDDCTPHTLTVDFTHTPSFTSTLIRQRRTSSARGGQVPPEADKLPLSSLIPVRRSTMAEFYSLVSK